MDFFVNFTLDEEFNEIIKSRFRDEFSYASFSEGEKQKIDLSLLFTWRDIAKMKNSVATNLLILDETFDSSLDHDGIENLLKGDDAAKWYDFALGKDKIIPGDISQSYSFDKEVVPQYEDMFGLSGPTSFTEGAPIGPPKLSTTFGPDTTYKNLGDSMSYFLNPGASKAAVNNPGLSGLASALTGDLDLMATAVPQIAGMYGGRMTEEEQWLAGKEKQIRLWAFQHGIPYEEAREIWKDGYRNPYYETRTPKDYNFQFNKGGIMQYKDDYTAGGSAVGPGTGTSDSIRPVALSDGEFVFTEEATNNFPGGAGGLYSLMNSLDPNSERPEEARV